MSWISYAASFPIFAVSGEAIAFLEARLPSSEIDASVGGLAKRLLVTAIILAALAVLAGIILGRQVTGPVTTLTDAVEKLGHGDFSTSIPVGGTREVGKLGRTIEDMRNNLIELTGTLRRREAEAQAVLDGIVEGVYAVDKSRVIRYLNPQAAQLLGVQAPRSHRSILRRRVEAVPRFERRASVRDQLPHSARSLRRQLAGDGTFAAERRRAAHHHHHQLAARSTSCRCRSFAMRPSSKACARARLGAGQHLARVPTPLAAQLASIELLRDGFDSMSTDQQKELVLSLERGALRLHAADRQSARKRAHRVGPAQHPSSGRGAGRGRRRFRSAGGRLAHAAPAASGSGSARRPAERRWRWPRA